jgi:phospho-N-acetylmuramoyl-pentapeptide-transferase
LVKCLFAFLTAFLISCFLGKVMIPMLKKFKVGQTILVYVKEHEGKNGTPTMGGLFFVFAIILTFFIFGGLKSHIARVCIVIMGAFMFVGFLDDFIKVRSKKNEGLKPYQKIIFQISIGLIAGVFAYKYGINFIYVPFLVDKFYLGLFTIPVLAIIFIAITNSVNLTDGIDGLSGSVSLIYLLATFFLIIIQTTVFKTDYYFGNDYKEVLLLLTTSIGAILGFLVYNVNKAKVFMGDTGSLALGGLIGSVSIFTANTLAIPFFGITFVLSSLSVIIQVVYFKFTKKRVFLMAPFHHHLQHIGLTENKIVYFYVLTTVIFAVIYIIGYLI